MTRDISLHLTDEEFVQFVLEDLPSEIEDEVGQHIERCEACARELDEYYETEEKFPTERWHADRGEFIEKLKKKLALGAESLAQTERKSAAGASQFPWMATALGDSGETRERASDTHWLEFAPDQCQWQLGQPELAKDKFGRITAQWKGGVLRVGVGGFLDVGPDATFDVTWNSISGEEKASGSPANKFVAVAELKPKDGLPPQAGERLRLQHKWTPTEGDGWEVRMDAFFVRKSSGELALADALLAANLKWEQAVGETMKQLAGFLAAMLCVNAVLRPAGHGVGRSEASAGAEVTASLDGLIADLDAGDTVILTGENLWVYMMIDQESLVIRADSGPAEAIEQFRIEFRRGSEVVVAADSHDGAVRLSLDQLQAARDGQAERMCVLI